MEWRETEIPDVAYVIPKVHGDARGSFKEVWNRREFARRGVHADFVQDNESRSRRGTLRGLHYQVQQPQAKLVRVLEGEVYDVAVDLRRASAHFGRWVARRLAAERHDMLWIPAGFAHGFYVLSETAVLSYKCTDFYAPEHERTILWNDAELAIHWPLAGAGPPLLSPKDEGGVNFRDAEYYA